MKKLVLFSSLILGLTSICFANVTLAQEDRSKTNTVTQSIEQEVQSPSDFIESLELTEEQNLKIQTILDRYRPELNAALQERLKARENLNNTLKPDSSEDEIRIARASFNHSNLKLKDLLFEELMALREVLTVEQRRQIDRKINEIILPKEPLTSEQE